METSRIPIGYGATRNPGAKVRRTSTRVRGRRLRSLWTLCARKKKKLGGVVGQRPSLGRTSPCASCGLPGTWRAGRPCPCSGLAPGGVCQPPRLPGALVVSYTTVSPLPVLGLSARPSAVCSLLPTVGSPRLGVPAPCPAGRTFLDRLGCRPRRSSGLAFREGRTGIGVLLIPDEVANQGSARRARSAAARRRPRAPASDAPPRWRCTSSRTVPGDARAAAAGGEDHDNCRRGWRPAPRGNRDERTPLCRRPSPSRTAPPPPPPSSPPLPRRPVRWRRRCPRRREPPPRRPRSRRQHRGAQHPADGQQHDLEDSRPAQVEAAQSQKSGSSVRTPRTGDPPRRQPQWRPPATTRLM